MSNNISQQLVQELLVGGLRRRKRVRRTTVSVPKPKPRAKPRAKQAGGLHPLLMAAAAPLAAAAGKAVLPILDKATKSFEPTRRIRAFLGIGRKRAPRQSGKGYALPGRVTAKPRPRMSPNVIIINPQVKAPTQSGGMKKALNSLRVKKAPLLNPY